MPQPTEAQKQAILDAVFAPLESPMTDPKSETHPSYLERTAGVVAEVMHRPASKKPQLLSHEALVEAAANWLKKRCSVVITELATIGETPDAIGWRGTHSYLVECKVSRSDFLADRSKSFRRNPWLGIGQHRFFLTPPGLVKVNELPDKWGLLELTGSKIRMISDSQFHAETNHRQELGILLSTLRRIGKNVPPGTSIKCYSIETKGRATLGVANSEPSNPAPA